MSTPGLRGANHAPSHNAAMRAWRLPIALACFGLLQGCAPALNWRDVPLPDAQLTSTFPCRPKIERHGPAGMARCEADGLVFALAWQRAASPEAAREIIRTSVKRFDAEFKSAGQRQTKATLPKGALDWPEAGQFKWPAAQTKIWARGLLVVQGTVLGANEAASAVFLDGIATHD